MGFAIVHAKTYGYGGGVRNFEVANLRVKHLGWIASDVPRQRRGAVRGSVYTLT